MSNFKKEIGNSNNLIKIKQEKENNTNIDLRKSTKNTFKLNQKDINKSLLRDKDLFKKSITKINCINNYKNKEKLNDLEIKKISTHKFFSKRKDKNQKELTIDNSAFKENNDFIYKIKVQKIYDFNELTDKNPEKEHLNNSNNNNKFSINNSPILNKIDSEDSELLKSFTLNKSNDFHAKEKIVSELEKKFIGNNTLNENKDKIQNITERRFPIFKSSFLINEEESQSKYLKKTINQNQYNQSIENLPSIKHAEINSFNESFNENIFNLSLKKNYQILNQSHKSPQLKLISNNSFINENIKTSKNDYRKKEKFTLFTENNSKRDFTFKSYSNHKIKKTLNKKDFYKISTNSNIYNKIIKNYKKEEKKLNNSSKAVSDNNLILNFRRDFQSPQKVKIKNSKTRNHFINFNKIYNIDDELIYKTVNWDKLLYCMEINKKLKSEVEILTEKNKTLKKLQNSKNHELEILRNKYSEAIKNYKQEMEINKELKNNSNHQKTFERVLKKYFKNLLNNLIEITELLLLSKSNTEKKASVIAAENGSLSIDIYDSYNNEEEKKKPNARPNTKSFNF